MLSSLLPFRVDWIILSIGILILFLYFFQRIIFCPKDLKNIKSLSAWKKIRTVYENKDLATAMKDSGLEELLDNGIMKTFIINWMVVVADADLAKFVLMNTDIFPKLIYSEIAPDSTVVKTLGNNIVFSNGETWRKYRRISHPAFHKVWTTDAIANISDQLLSILKQSQYHKDISDLMKRLTLDVLGKTIFGYDFKALQDPKSKFRVQYQYIIKESFNYLFFFLFPLDRPFVRRKYARTLAEFNNFFYEIIRHKRNELKKKKLDQSKDNTLLDLMLDTSINEATQLSDLELRDNLFIFFLAGHDTTASSLASSLYFLAKHQDIQQKARQEVLTIMNSSETFPSFDQQKKMKYLTQIIKETLRICPPVIAPTERISSKAFEYDFYKFPEKTIFSINIYALHHNPRYWNEPEKFNPDRFENEKFNPPYYLPFSDGSRICLGMNFSLMEQRVVLSMILKNFSIILPENSLHSDSLKLEQSDLTSPLNLDLKFIPICP